MQDYTEVYKALDKAKFTIIGRTELVFFTTVMLNLEHIVDKTIPTACVDGYTIRYNPQFVMDLTHPERVFLVLHEVMHVVLMHLLREQDRNHERWNMAGDYVINYYLHHMEGMRGVVDMPDMALYKKEYGGLTTEQVYNKLEDEQAKAPQNMMDDLAPPDGDGQGQQESGSGMTKEKLKQHIDDIIMQAHTVYEQEKSRSDGGSLPEEIQLYINSLKSPKLPWNRVLQKFMNEISKVDYTFRKPNRRYFPDHYLPTITGYGLDRIAIAIDVSGSIRPDELHIFISEVYGIVQKTKPKVVDVILFHHEIVSVTPVRNVQDLMKVQMRGSGGTLIDPVLNWCEENKPQGLIVFTDGWIEHDYRKLKIPTIWTVYGNPSFKPKFGNSIEYPLTS